MPRRLHPGQLRHRITIQTLTRVSDSRGGTASTWATHASAWASMTAVSAREAFQRGAVGGERLYKATLRYQAGIDAEMRVSWDSRIFKILGVRDVDGTTRVLELDLLEEPV